MAGQGSIHQPDSFSVGTDTCPHSQVLTPTVLYVAQEPPWCLVTLLRAVLCLKHECGWWASPACRADIT